MRKKIYQACQIVTFAIAASGVTTNSTIAQSRPVLSNQAELRYVDRASQIPYSNISRPLGTVSSGLVDPLGRVLGCNGELLPDYRGFSVALYEPNPSDPTGTELGNLVTLTPTESPDIPGNGIRPGLSPNVSNINPFSLTNGEGGRYNFLFDPNRAQTAPGRTYILVINPPANSIYRQRRIKIEILTPTGTVNNNIVRYLATSLDDQPISSTGGTNITDTVVFVPDAERVGLDLLSLQFSSLLCQSEQMQLVKSGDRATAEPGDSVIYRLSIRNQSDAGLTQIQATDTLPTGFKFLANSVRAEVGGQSVPVTTETQGSTVIFRSSTTIPRGSVLNIAYATQLTPDALRGSGRNSAIVNGQRVDNGFAVKDGPATHQLRIRPGITSDCGTIIGRVFEDKNQDGEQQENEPGIPNAVVFLDDGNRITTDKNGLFSVANVLPGNRAGVLDLNSIPSYTLPPNPTFRERRSQSRLVRLAPGGLVRMNFGVVPVLRKEGKS
jgi:uncharacterized repeat protein (TIGR01451 family)